MSVHPDALHVLAGKTLIQIYNLQLSSLAEGQKNNAERDSCEMWSFLPIDQCQMLRPNKSFKLFLM